MHISIFLIDKRYILINVPYAPKYSWVYIYIGQVGRVFANGPGDPGSISGRIIPKTLKMVLDTYLLNIQYYKQRIKGKVEQSREKSRALPCTSV